jgi:hypothetical protein
MVFDLLSPGCGSQLRPGFLNTHNRKIMDNKESQLLTLRENASNQLAQIKDIETGTDFIDRVKALETYAKATKQDAEMVKMIQEQKIRSMRILGKLLEETDLGGNREQNLKQNTESSTTQPSVKPTLSDYGITKDESSTYQTIAAIPEDEFNKQMDELKDNNSTVKEITITRFKNVGKEYKRENKIKEAVKNEWPEDQQEMKRKVEMGETVTINMNKHLHILNWANSKGLYERVDRFTEWGNPFELGKDGNRDEVCDAYELHYFPYKKSLHHKIDNLKGKVLGCHCHPQRCHGHFLSNQANSKV